MSHRDSRAHPVKIWLFGYRLQSCELNGSDIPGRIPMYYPLPNGYKP